MDPEIVREVLQIIDEVSQPVYAAAYQKVIVTNAVLSLALLVALVAMAWLARFSWRKFDKDDNACDDLCMFGVIAGTIGAVACFLVIIFCMIILLAADYSAYQSIRQMIL